MRASAEPAFGVSSCPQRRRLGPRLVHTPSEPSGSQRSPAVSSGRSFAQVAGAILRKQARGQNPDKDEGGGSSPPRPTKRPLTSGNAVLVVQVPVGSEASRSGMRCTGFEANWPSYRPDQHFRSWAACPHGGALGRTAVGDHIRFELYAAKRGERSAVSRFGESAT
jgi:hypothetical protein